MNPPAELFPLVEEMALARTRAAFAAAFEEAARHWGPAEGARFYEHRLGEGALVFGADDVAVALDAATLPGACALVWQPVPGDGRPHPGLEGAGETLALPVLIHGSLRGVLAVAAPALPPEAVERLSRLCDAAGLIFESACRQEELSRYMARSEELFVKAVEGLGDGAGHVVRVGRLASEIGKQLDFTHRAGELLWQAAQWHDVGKLALQGRTPFEIEQHHAQAGGAFLRSFPSLRELAPLVEVHHERYDGTGFPQGLSGDAVPLEGWVLSAAEDLAEFKGDAQDFLHERVGAHHPEVLRALRELLAAGQLP